VHRQIVNENYLDEYWDSFIVSTDKGHDLWTIGLKDEKIRAVQQVTGTSVQTNLHQIRFMTYRSLYEYDENNGSNRVEVFIDAYYR